MKRWRLLVLVAGRIRSFHRERLAIGKCSLLHSTTRRASSNAYVSGGISGVASAQRSRIRWAVRVRLSPTPAGAVDYCVALSGGSHHRLVSIALRAAAGGT